MTPRWATTAIFAVNGAAVGEVTHLVAEAAAPDALLDPYRAAGVSVTRA